MQYIDAKYDLLINGEWVPAEGGETFETFNPANGEKLADCANASPADIDRAVAAARAAFPARGRRRGRRRRHGRCRRERRWRSRRASRRWRD